MRPEASNGFADEAGLAGGPRRHVARAPEAIDRVVLDADERRRRRVVLTGEGGTRFLLDLAAVTALRDGDGLVLDDSTIVAVVAKPEPLIEAAASDAAALARLAWHLGNRHVELQVAGDTLRMRRDHVLEDMLRRLGARVTPIEASFEPERGAYDHDHPGRDPWLRRRSQLSGQGAARSAPAPHGKPALLPLPACGERVGVRGRFPTPNRASSGAWRGPLTRRAGARRPLPARGER